MNDEPLLFTNVSRSWEPDQADFETCPDHVTLHQRLERLRYEARNEGLIPTGVVLHHRGTNVKATALVAEHWTDAYCHRWMEIMYAVPPARGRGLPSATRRLPV